MYKRGFIYWANLEPGNRSEPGKVRPVLVFQEDWLSEIGHPSTIIIPMTTSITPGADPLRYLVKKRGRLSGDSDLLIDQVRAIDNKRFSSGEIGNLSSSELDIVDDYVKIILGF